MDSTVKKAIDQAKEYLDSHMKPSRIRHTSGVVETSEKLAVKYGVDPDKARIASWYHDLVRNMPVEELDDRVDLFGLDPELKGRPNLSHSKVAAEMMKREFDITDQDIINAVSYHTTGRAGMSRLEKVVYLADAIEPGRDYPGVDRIRRLAALDLDEACLASIENTIKFVSSQGVYMDPDTIKAKEDLSKKE